MNGRYRISDQQSGTVYERLELKQAILFAVSVGTNSIVKKDSNGIRRVEYGHNRAGEQSGSVMMPDSC